MTNKQAGLNRHTCILLYVIKPVFAIALLFLLPGILPAQNIEKSGISVNAQYGYVWSHTGEVDNLKSHVYGGSIGYRVKTAGRKQWQRMMNNPSWGVLFFYQYYGKVNITGSVYAALPYVEFPVFRLPRFEIGFRLTTGIGYITKPFDVATNVQNRAIGSHFNGNMCLHGTFNYSITKNIELSGTAGIVHFSNGNFRMPNLGINSPAVSLGANFYFRNKIVENPQPDAAYIPKREFVFTLATAVKNVDYIFNRSVIVGMVQAKYLHSLSYKNKLMAGLDLFYDNGDYYIVNRGAANSKEAKLQDVLEIGLKIGHELRFDRVSLITDLGFYLFNKNEVKGHFYQRVGFGLRLTDNVGIYTALKVHFANADYFEWGINYKLFKKQP